MVAVVVVIVVVVVTVVTVVVVVVTVVTVVAVVVVAVVVVDVDEMNSSSLRSRPSSSFISAAWLAICLAWVVTCTVLCVRACVCLRAYVCVCARARICSVCVPMYETTKCSVTGGRGSTHRWHGAVEASSEGASQAMGKREIGTARIGMT